MCYDGACMDTELKTFIGKIGRTEHQPKGFFPRVQNSLFDIEMGRRGQPDVMRTRYYLEICFDF